MLPDSSPEPTVTCGSLKSSRICGERSKHPEIPISTLVLLTSFLGEGFFIESKADYPAIIIGEASELTFKLSPPIALFLFLCSIIPLNCRKFLCFYRRPLISYRTPFNDCSELCLCLIN